MSNTPGMIGPRKWGYGSRPNDPQRIVFTKHCKTHGFFRRYAYPSGQRCVMCNLADKLQIGWISKDRHDALIAEVMTHMRMHGHTYRRPLRRALIPPPPRSPAPRFEHRRLSPRPEPPPAQVISGHPRAIVAILDELAHP